MTTTRTPDLGELALSYATRINALHEQGQQIDIKIRDDLLEKLRITRECGILLEDAKSALPHQQWEAVQAELNFGTQAQQTYLRFAAKNKEPITDATKAMRELEPALMVTGFLNFPDGHGRQQLHDADPVSELTRHSMEIQALWNKRIRHDIHEWSTERRQSLRDQLKPIVLIYDALAV